MSTTRRFTTALLAVPVALALASGTGYAAGSPAADLQSDGTSAAPAEAKAVIGPQRVAAAESVDAVSVAPTPGPSGGGGGTPDSSASSDKQGTPTSGPLSSPQPISNADSSGSGANPGGTEGGTCTTHAYCSTRDGSASGNGNGGGDAVGQPCAGCVGKADNKDPQGQAPDGTDANNGYECDGNSGIGKTNPAHTGCKTPAPTSTPTPTPTSTSTPTPTPTSTSTPTPTPTSTVTPSPSPSQVGSNNRPTELCPDGSPMPSTGAKDCPKPQAPELCPDGSPMPSTGPQDCRTLGSGTVTPVVGPPTEPVVPSTGVVTTPVRTTVPTAGEASVDELPATGGDAVLLLALGVLLLISGSCVTALARQPRLTTA